ncbi:hypothetical protein B0T21DRAFT_124717 [Apiosordaria backusii]|uniref:Uncharacterized protein n=1 Tax=Apiosordaria backusii TaxID=314023 RepID=A0AA40EMQ4_9PEZI|nr:hypothetical protein B0T21DRAFT_124717 [Apiosordaria backusii]
MSGFEIAGIVLGASPLIIEGSKLVRGYLEMSIFWLKFSTKFPDMVAAVEDELMAFRQNVELLLRPLALGVETESRLLNDGNSTKWHDPSLQSLLRTRIGNDKFIWFLGKLRRFNNIIGELSAVMMPIHDGRIRLPSPGTVDHAVLRLAVSFTNKRDLMREITSINIQISRFLEADLRIAQATILAPAIMGKGQKNIQTAAAPFFDLQSQTVKLYRSFRPDNWICGCQKLHPCGIGTVWDHDHSRRPRKGSIKLLLGSGGPLQYVPVQVGVGVHDGKDTSAVLNDDDDTNGPLIDHVADLTAQIRLDSDFESHVKAGKKKKTTILALSSFQTAVNPVTSNPESSWLPRETAKLTKSHSPKRHVRFAHQRSDPSPAKTCPVPIDLQISCNLLTAPLSVLGQLEANIHHEDKAITLTAEKQLTRERGLVSVYKSMSLLDHRIRVGVKLAYTILGLGTSPWIPQAWDDRDIQVIGENPALLYFQHTSIRSALKREIADAREHAQMAMFTLGIVLLQLLFQERIEDQPYYKSHCDSNGVAHDWTHWRAA